MPHPCPHHCPKPGGSGAALLVVLAVVVIAAIARPVVHAAIDVLEVAAIVLGSAAALGILGGVAYVAWRVRRWQARNRQAISRHAPAAQALSGPHRRAIEAPRPRPHTLSTSEARAADNTSDTRSHRHPG